ncbi:hypothetical protein QAD02_007597 [Eretmocerus hayati]|uniref:Uncharacterized protein n=1 Tax=Eretmocerus hayati TaxID=131215 RepID=A0ACC2N434_9HYME|nr:hypothetical protein QAD02_007597 [Eretmocerus hayati]
MPTRQYIDWDIASLFPVLPSTQSPDEAVMPVSSSKARADTPPLSIQEMIDDIDTSLEIPPTPATPSHLERGEDYCQDNGNRRIKLLPRTDGSTIRMCITRCDGNSAETNDDSVEE